MARFTIPAIPAYSCVRRLSFDGGTFVDIRAPVSIDHPASAAAVDRTILEAHCRAFARVGVLIDFVRNPSASGQTYQINVIVTSSGSSLYNGNS